MIVPTAGRLKFRTAPRCVPSLKTPRYHIAGFTLEPPSLVLRRSRPPLDLESDTSHTQRWVAVKRYGKMVGIGLEGCRGRGEGWARSARNTLNATEKRRYRGL